MKTIGKVVLALVATVAAVFLALTCGSYGAIGVHAAFTEHLAWTEAAMVYWTLLFTAVLSAMAALFTWVLVFRHAKGTEQLIKSK